MASRKSLSSLTLLDTTGLLCPLPVLKLRKFMSSLSPGDSIRVIADDPAAAIDVPHFCSEHGHDLVSQEYAEGTIDFVVCKGGKSD